jgi:DNA-binding NarL/FixJ family response regulator
VDHDVTAPVCVVRPSPSFPLAGMRGRGPSWEVGGVLLRCLIVDDNRRFLAAARGLLEGQGVTVVGVATTGVEATRLAQEMEPDVVLLDIDLGDESGFDVATQLAARSGGPRVIMVSTHAEEDYADLIAASPAVGFVAKSALSAGAIRDLLDGRGGDRVSVPRGR